MKAAKTKQRIELLDTVMEVISSNEDIYDVIDYKRKSEDAIKQHMYHPLLKKLEQRLLDKGISPKNSTIKAKQSLIWEGNKQSVLHNMMLFGCQHRPDMELKIDGMNIAIEVKKGSRGSDLRNGFGQCLIYSTKYDFVMYLFVDTSDDKRIKNSYYSDKEYQFSTSMWENYNVMFDVV